jgi:hypothetical protein
MHNKLLKFSYISLMFLILTTVFLSSSEKTQFFFNDDIAIYEITIDCESISIDIPGTITVIKKDNKTLSEQNEEELQIDPEEEEEEEEVATTEEEDELLNIEEETEPEEMSIRFSVYEGKEQGVLIILDKSDETIDNDYKIVTMVYKVVGNNYGKYKIDITLAASTEYSDNQQSEIFKMSVSSSSDGSNTLRDHLKIFQKIKIQSAESEIENTLGKAAEIKTRFISKEKIYIYRFTDFDVSYHIICKKEKVISIEEKLNGILF